MSFLPSTLVSHLATHYGVVDRITLVEHGVTAHELDSHLRAGTIRRVHTGVFQVSTSPESFASRCLAACLADAELVLCGPTAARIWKFKHTGKPDAIHVIVPHDRTPVSRGVVLRRSNALPTSDIVTLPTGVRLTAPTRTWFDRARDMTDHYFEALTEHVLDKYATMPTLWATVRRLCVKGRPGAARVRRVVSQRPAWQKPADSTLEFEVIKAFRERGVHFVQQQSITLRNGRKIHLDAADPEIKFGIEIDHYEWHQGRAAAERDDQRNRSTEKIGWRVLRITDHAWRADRSGILTDIVEIYVARGGRLVSQPSRAVSRAAHP